MWLIQARPHFFRDALDIPAGGGGFIHVVGVGQFPGELGVFLWSEIGSTGASEQGNGFHW